MCIKIDDIEQEIKNLIEYKMIKIEKKDGIKVEFDKDHSSILKNNNSAVYIFVNKKDGIVLKVGRVARNSNARFIYQHYNLGSAKSSLANSLYEDEKNEYNTQHKNKEFIKNWIINNTERFNIFININDRKEQDILTNFIEAYFQLKYFPKYEGKNTAK